MEKTLGTVQRFDGWMFWRFELPVVSDEEHSAFQHKPICRDSISDSLRFRACAEHRRPGNGMPMPQQCGEIGSSKGGGLASGADEESTTPDDSGFFKKIDYVLEYEYGFSDEDCRKCENGKECSASGERVHVGHVNPCAGMGNLSSQPGEKKPKGAAKDGDGKSGPSKFRFGRGDSKHKTAGKADKRHQTEYDGSSQAKRRSSTDFAVHAVSTPSPGSSMSSSVYVDTHSHLPTPVEQAAEDDSILEGDSQILDDGTNTLQDASPGSLSDITVFCDEGKQEVMSNIIRRPPSASQSLPGTPGDTHLESNFATMGYSTMYDSRTYRAHTETESSSYSSGGRDLSTSSSSSSMDLLDHFHKQRGSLDSGGPPSTLPFTITQHRKVVLPPHKFAGPPPASAGVPNGKSGFSGSEECLRPANLYGTTGAEHQSSSPSRRHSSYGDVPPLDGNVLRKVASLTLDKATIDSKVNRPKFVPEKLDFSLYEKFEGNSRNAD